MPTSSFGDDLHRIARQCDARVAYQQQRLCNLLKAEPGADLSQEEQLLQVLVATRKEAHQALRRHLAK